MQKLELDYDKQDIKILEVLYRNRSPLWEREIKKRANLAWMTVRKHLKSLVENNCLKGPEKSERKNYYELTDKGKNVCNYFKIKREAGYSGVEWASEKLDEGYKVRFLNDLTGKKEQENLLFAWHPMTGDIELALIFGVRTFPKDGYVGQYVDREKDPDKPIRENKLHTFVKENVSDLDDEGQISKVLKKFYDEEMHNSFVALLTPPPSKPVHFGFPQEIGNFGAMVFLGFGYQKCFPFIPRISIGAGTFSLSENTDFHLYYDLNLCALYNVAVLHAKRIIDLTIKEDMIQFWDKDSFTQIYGIVCKNLIQIDLKCKMMGIECPYIELKEERKVVNMERCPITANDLKKLKVINPLKKYGP